MKFTKKKFREHVNCWLERYTENGFDNRQDRDNYEAVANAIMQMIWKPWKESEHNCNERKQRRAYYFSAEFLMGRALGNNLINLGVHEAVAQTLRAMNIDLNAVEEAEPDAALGNGGLGRLAACFIESLATLNLPARGYGIRYKYGMFRQKIVAGKQEEAPDYWGSNNDPWSVRREHRQVVVRFGGRVESSLAPDGTPRFRLVDTEDVLATPYDMPIIGWDTGTINTLRLWEAESASRFNIELFNNMEYLRALEPNNRAKDISRVLYPNDSGRTGKTLRLRQQYFFTSASLQDVFHDYKMYHGNDLSHFSSKVVIQLNDTHPVIAILELMRIFLDEEELGWDKAWDITTQTFAYTNHTVLAEALEKWSIDLFRTVCPRLMLIVEEINRRFILFLMQKYPEDQARYHRMSIIADGMIKMVHLAIVGSFSVNGVASLHTKILETDVLRDWYELWPKKFNNKTNGVTQRRWLKKANPSLASLLDDIVGSQWTKNLSLLGQLKESANDNSALQKIGEIKKDNKVRLAKLTKKVTGLIVDPDSLFDVQIKRLHEYKRQLLNILSVIHDWQYLKDNPNSTMPPRTIFFGAKAALGYRRAKQIIHLINVVAEKINKDKSISDKLKVVFVPDYRVSVAEVIFPGAEISQQISTAGKEASGTGNMKFMMNGAITLGTMDGANIEIVEEVGMENAFIFGMGAEEVAILRNSGKNNPWAILEANPALDRALKTLIDGTLCSEDTFRELYDSLVYGVEGSVADMYFVLTDFASYQNVREKMNLAWLDKTQWNRMALLNIAGSGRFSSDRTIQEYASDIWKIEP